MTKANHCRAPYQQDKGSFFGLYPEIEQSSNTFSKLVT